MSCPNCSRPARLTLSEAASPSPTGHKLSDNSTYYGNSKTELGDRHITSHHNDNSSSLITQNIIIGESALRNHTPVKEAKICLCPIPGVLPRRRTNLVLLNLTGRQKALIWLLLTTNALVAMAISMSVYTRLESVLCRQNDPLGSTRYVTWNIKIDIETDRSLGCVLRLCRHLARVQTQQQFQRTGSLQVRIISESVTQGKLSA